MLFPRASIVAKPAQFMNTCRKKVAEGIFLIFFNIIKSISLQIIPYFLNKYPCLFCKWFNLLIF
jgi:hypothetical protein